MKNTFEYKGFHFMEIDSTNPHRPYRVLCIEKNIEKDSAISYADAASLLITPIISANEKLISDSQNMEYVSCVFEKTLIGKKQSECNELVENEIVSRGLIYGDVICVTNPEKFPTYIDYKTNYFTVKVIFEERIPRKAKQIIVEAIQ